MVVEILAIVAALGLPSVGLIIWRAGLNKLDERFMTRDAFVKLKADVDDEMAGVRTSHQTLMGRWDALDEKVSIIMSDERHRSQKLERMEAQLTSAAEKLHKLEVDQVKGFSTLKDEIRDHVNVSMARALEEIRDMVNRKI